jgi:hypothetical protein
VKARKEEGSRGPRAAAWAGQAAAAFTLMAESRRSLAGCVCCRGELQRSGARIWGLSLPELAFCSSIARVPCGGGEKGKKKKRKKKKKPTTNP